MRALFYDGALRVADVPTPAPGPGEALIRVREAGICNTDVEITRGYKGFSGVLGHEFVGEVIDCSDESWLGRRVVGEINITCGRCARCRRGHPSHCSERTVLGILGHDGAFAEYVVLPTCNLHRVPESVADDEAVFIEPVAAAYEIAEQVELSIETTVIVLGDGKLGILCAQVAARCGAEVVLCGRHEPKLAVARSLGIECMGGQAVRRDVDVVIEATGSPAGLAQALELVRPRGVVVLKSTTSALAQIDLNPIVVNEISVIGSRCGPFDRAIRGLQEGEVRVRELISERYPLGEAPTAMERAAAPDVLKVLLDVCPR